VPELRIQVQQAQAVQHAVTPTVALRLQLSNGPAREEIHSVLLRCQLQIDAQRRAYQPGEEEPLGELFGGRHRWQRTLRPLLWAQVSANVPGFCGETTFDLHAPCTRDLDAASSKYFHALAGGEVPLVLLFSGTIFYRDENDELRVALVPASCEARFAMPLQAWRDSVEACFPNSGYLTLQRDVLAKLYRYKMRSGLPDWERAIEALLERAP
jgi:hypothetical protein